jgi:WD40 repeat protein/DNA polymerase III delta prime subunit
MEGSLKASIQGLDAVDQARKRKGWNRQSAAWAQAALTSIATLKQFWRRERINRETFIRICQGVGIEDWQAIADLAISPDLQTTPPLSTCVQDWGEAPELSSFYGREQELATLCQWIDTDRAKLLLLLGMGGVGKTSLAVRLAESVLDQFDCLIWRSLRNAPAPHEWVLDLLKRLNHLQEWEGLETTQPFSALLTQLMTELRQRRCLLILDNAESILQPGNQGSMGYHPGYELYGELLHRIGEERHQSCLLLTSREQPRELIRLEGDKVRSLRLGGVLPTDGQKILEAMGSLSASAAEYGQIVAHYGGNPLALKIAAAGIRDLLHGNVSSFFDLMHQGSFIFGDIQDLLERHFERLSNFEQELLYWLAIAREPVTLEELKIDLLSPESRWLLPETVERLQRRSLLESHIQGFTLQPVVMEFVTQHLVEKICGEILIENPYLFCNHSLMKATVKDYVRKTQIKLIIEPLIQQLENICDDVKDIENHFLKIIQKIRGKPALKTGYVGGNIFNLLTQMHLQLKDYDFSYLTLWQADLRVSPLHQIKLAHCDLSRAALTEIFSKVLAIAFSSDGVMMAQTDERGWMSVWQVETGSQLLSVKAHSDWAFSVAFHPQGTMIATGGMDRTVKLWEVSSGKCLQTLEHHKAGVSVVTFSQDGTWLASASADQTIQLVHLPTGQCQPCLTGHQGIVRAIAFTADGQTLVSASLDQTLKCWDIQTGECLQTLTETLPVHTVACSPQETEVIASATSDGRITLWNWLTSDRQQTLDGHTNNLWSLAFSPDGETLISAGDDRVVKVWDIALAQCINTLSGHENRIWAVAVNPVTPILASGSEDRTLRLWNLTDGRCIRTLQGYHNSTVPIAFWSQKSGSQESGVNVSEATGIAGLRNIERSQEIENNQNLELLQNPKSKIQNPNQESEDKRQKIGGGRNADPAFSTSPSSLSSPSHLPTFPISPILPTSPILLTFSADQGVRFWHPRTQECLRTFHLPTKAALHVTMRPDGGMIASGNLDGTIHLCETMGGHCLQVLAGHGGWVRSVAFNPAGTLLASAGGDRTVRIWEVATGTCLKILQAHTNAANSVTFHASGQWLASGSWDCTIKIWDIETGTCLHTLAEHRDRITGISFNPRQEILYSSSQDGTVRVWDWANNQSLQVLQENRVGIVAIACSPNGEILATASQDNLLRLWNLAPLTCLATFPVPMSYGDTLVFSPNSEILATSGDDGTSTLWHIPSQQSLATLQVPRPYEGMDITQISGLTEAQKATLRALGAREWME